MDLKDIIKWFIPCFHILLFNFKMDSRLTFVCLFIFFNLCPSSAAKVNYSYNAVDLKSDVTKNSSDSNLINDMINQSVDIGRNFNEPMFKEDISEGRTFGLRFRKMAQALIPLVFQLGAASTWAVVAAIIGFKTLLVTLVILKLLLLAGAAKVGAFFASHKPHNHGWHPPDQKEIHLHIHNGQHGHTEEHEISSYPTWNRDSIVSSDSSKNLNFVYDPYSAGPQTISTPYGHYVKVDPSTSGSAG